MNKRVCDRCGKEIDVLSFVVKHFSLSKCEALLGKTDFDLCEDCERDLEAWLRKDNNGCGCSDCAKEVASLNEKIKQLETENEMLRNRTVKELLETMDVEVSVSIKKKDE